MHYEIKNGSIEINGETIIEEINIKITSNSHIGIVGRNGAGKTTLLKALIDNDMLSQGVGEEDFSITRLGNIEIGYLSQVTFNDINVTLESVLESANTTLFNLKKRIEELESNLSNNSKLIEEYTNKLEKYKILGGYSYKKEYEVMLSKFGFSSSDKERLISSFSGGERTKISLMKLLLSKPSILFLDEPTNHLDITTINYLENYLHDYKSAIVLVSHDRMFLNNIVNNIYEIEYGKTNHFEGNYEYYEKEKEIRYQKLLKDYNYQQKEIKRLKDIYERFKYKPSKASMALSKLKQIEKMTIIEKPSKPNKNTFKTDLDNIDTTSRKVISLKNLSIGYDNNVLQENINIDIERGDRLGIIGVNGSGKSTLLKTIMDVIPKIKGKIIYGDNLKIGYFDQDLAMISSDNTILEEFKLANPSIDNEKARTILGSYLFSGEDVNKKIKVLSGGEKVRLSLCKILYNKPNVLILDEPTNHLDIIGKKRLEDILLDYEGTIIFVSHDRYFISKIANRLLEFKNNSNEVFNMSYKKYLEVLNTREDNVVIEEIPKVNKEKIVKNNYDVNKDIKSIEKKITNLELEIKNLKDSLLEEDNYLDYQKSNSINKEIEQKENTLLELNNKWEELVSML